MKVETVFLSYVASRNDLDLILNGWEYQFAVDMESRISQGKTLSTAQAEKLLVVMGKVADQHPNLQIAAALANPEWARPPYTTVKIREQCATVLPDGRILIASERRLVPDQFGTVLPGNAAFPISPKLWVVTPTPTNARKIVTFLARMEINCDDSVTTLLGTIPQNKGLQANVVTDPSGLSVAVVPDHEALDLWFRSFADPYEEDNA